MRSLYGWKFVLTVALPLLLASLGVAALTADLLSRVSTGANVEDRERTRQVVRSALGAAQRQLANLATDNSYWDDAVRSTSGDVDQEWAVETWGVSTDPGINYDLFMVVDRALPKAVAGYRRGEAFQPDHASYFDGQLDRLIDSLPAGSGMHPSASGIVRTDDGLAVAATAPILPTSEDISVQPDRPRYLVFLKFLTPEHVAAIGEQYVIGDLRLIEAPSTAVRGELIRAPDGTVIGKAVWSDRRPGDVAIAAVSKKTALVLGFLAAVMIGIGVLCWQLIGRIAAREAAAVHDARHDSLTGLPNRSALIAESDRLLAAGGQTVVAAFIDLDGFKDVNDTYDHETGDRLIRAVAAGLVSLAKDTAMVCRLGGDEFVALFCGPDSERDAEQFSARLLAFLAAPFDFEGRLASVGASIGLAVAGSERIDTAELMRRADVAMYKAKNAGRNRHCSYRRDFDAERIESQSIAGELRGLIDAGAIDVVYQPVVDARTRKIVGVEALARWPSAASRQIAADLFIKVAEQNGLIDDLGAVVLRKACADAARWPGLRLAVNISPVQLRRPDFVDVTLRIIAASGLDPSRVELEITESTLVEDIGRARQMFAELRAAGVQIALDDFGTGFSSIGYLRAFEFDRIKVDRSLVGHLVSSMSEQAIVQGTILMAAGLTARVTAEGVEAEDQANLLRLTGCTELQGYLFHRPMDADAMSRVLEMDAATEAAA